MMDVLLNIKFGKTETNGSTVEHYKIIEGAQLAWSLFQRRTNQDIHASEKIWEIFSKYDINGLISTSTSYRRKYKR